MSILQDCRRRLMVRFGRPMTLRRQTGINPQTFADVVVSGVLSTFQPEQITAGVQQGDARVAILNDEILAAGWPGPPRAKDVLVVDRTWQLLGSMACYDRGLVIGHYLWVRGAGGNG